MSVCYAYPGERALEIVGVAGDVVLVGLCDGRAGSSGAGSGLRRSVCGPLIEMCELGFVCKFRLPQQLTTIKSSNCDMVNEADMMSHKSTLNCILIWPRCDVCEGWCWWGRGGSCLGLGSSLERVRERQECTSYAESKSEVKRQFHAST